jgi:N-acetylneuraminic acid mutarotase
MKLIKQLLLVAVASTSVVLQSCNTTTTTTTQGNWVKAQPFKGVPRTGLVTFTIGDKVYAGLGYNGKDYLSDFYVLEGGIWKTLASFPKDIGSNNKNDHDNLRERATAFAVGGNGYVGLGYNRDNDGINQQLSDFWKYDPAANQWTQLKDFPGGRRYNVVSVGIGENGYLGTGYDGTSWFGDFWKYTPGTDTWTEIVSYPGDKREGGSAFILNNKIMLAGGKNNGLYISDLWEYDPATSAWTKRAPASNDEDYSDFKAAVRRSNAVFFAFNSYAYMALGGTPSLSLTIYELDPSTYKWTQKSNFEGSSRQNAIWYVTGGKAYVGLGEAGSSHYDDIWEWRPLEDSNLDD